MLVRTNFITLFLLFSNLGSQAQAIRHTEQPIDYASFMELVLEHNIGYASQKLNIDIAEAQTQAAKLFNDPQLSVGYVNNADRSLKLGQVVSAELSKTFSPGKRSARIDLANGEEELSRSLLTDYLHNLRAEATLAYLETLKQSELFKVVQSSYDNLLRLAQEDSLKYLAGNMTRVDVIESTLQAGMVSNELIQARTDLQNSYASLRLWTGTFNTGELYLPQGSMIRPQRDFEASELLELAVYNRADLAAALNNIDVANKALKVTKRERGMDFDLGLGLEHNTESRSDIAPVPRFNAISVNLSIPLKFSNLNRGQLSAAQFKARQAQYDYEQAELEIKTTVMENLRQYLSLAEQIKQYDSGMLTNAKAIVDEKIISYERGESSLHELLNARQIYNQLQTTYIETLYNYAASLVNLERSAGIWDISIR